MNYVKVIIDFYCPKHGQDDSEKQHPMFSKPTKRSPGYEVGSISPGIWPVAAGVVAARHF